MTNEYDCITVKGDIIKVSAYTHEEAGIIASRRTPDFVGIVNLTKGVADVPGEKRRVGEL